MTTSIAAVTPALLQHKATLPARNTEPGQLIEGLQAKDARTRFGCAKALRRLAELEPQRLYPAFDTFARLLDHQNKILQWEGAIVLSHLARVDAENKFEPLFGKYFSPISGPVMITAANVIRGGGRIARARPGWADRIAAELLKVRTARYATAECRNVAIGHTITAFGEFFDLLRKPAPVVQFVKKQVRNPRCATAKKAEALIKMIRKEGSSPRRLTNRGQHGL